MAAPMTDVSGPELVAAVCAAGVIGTFPTHNAADSVELERWLHRIGEQVAARTPPGRRAAPVGVNLVVHRSNARLADDLRTVIRGGAEVVVTSVGSPREIVGPLHDAGIIVLADVASLRHVQRAAASGVDGVVLLTAGAGGQTGWANPFAFLRAVRQRYDGIVVIAGGISDGAGILAAQVLGADLAYLGTRFIATTESLASAAYRDAVVAATLDDVTASRQVTGLLANVLTDWLRGVDPATPRAASDGPASRGPGPDGPAPDGPVRDGPVRDGPVRDGPVPDGPVPDGPVPDGPVPDGPVPDGPAPDGPAPDGPVPAGFSVDRLLARRGVWAAGHSVSGTDAVIGVAELVNRLERELELARQRLLPADMPAAGCR
jgi:nitronate monooxygenase